MSLTETLHIQSQRESDRQHISDLTRALEDATRTVVAQKDTIKRLHDELAAEQAKPEWYDAPNILSHAAENAALKAQIASSGGALTRFLTDHRMPEYAADAIKEALAALQVPALPPGIAAKIIDRCNAAMIRDAEVKP